MFTRILRKKKTLGLGNLYKLLASLKITDRKDTRPKGFKTIDKNAPYKIII